MTTPTDDLERRLRTGPLAAPPAATGGGAATGYAPALAAARAAAADAGLVDVAWATVDSPVGELVVAATPVGVVLLGWDVDAALTRLAAEVSPRVLAAPGRLDDARRQLDEYFAGARDRFELPVDWSLSRGFRQVVLHELVRVPYGSVVSYGELAVRVGNPRAARAVGSAMATNPIPVIVPCHRVLPRGGGLGSYSGRDGVVTKRFLLDLEGARRP